MRVTVYDLEIEKCIPPRSGERDPGLSYCEGWRDHAGMGISVLCALSYEVPPYPHDDSIECARRGYRPARPRVFLADNREEFFALLSMSDVAVGFNNLAFDNRVIEACWGLTVDGPYDQPCPFYDLLLEMWIAAGLGPTFNASTHANFGLDNTAGTNLGTRKTGHGERAPVQWQRGDHGAVIDYCLADVWLTAALFNRVLQRGSLRDPRGGDDELAMRSPFPAEPLGEEVSRV